MIEILNIKIFINLNFKYRKSMLITPLDKEFSSGKKAAILKIFLNKTFEFIFF
jgi:hypothetical protein